MKRNIWTVLKDWIGKLWIAVRFMFMVWFVIMSFIAFVFIVYLAISSIIVNVGKISLEVFG